MAAEFVPGLVSVIVPTYNRAHILPATMDTIWAQDYRPIELVVADDGSTDDTRSVVDRWSDEHAGHDDFTVRYVHQQNAGQAAARDLGLVESTGEYLQLLDSDDHMHPERLSTMVRAARDIAGFQMAVSAFAPVDEEGRALRRPIQPELEVRDLVGLHIWGCMWLGSVMFHRDFVREVGLLRPELHWGEDWEWGIRVAMRTVPERCAVVRKSLTYYRRHEGPRVVTAEHGREQMMLLVQTARRLLTCERMPMRYHDLVAMKMVSEYIRQDQKGFDCLRTACELPSSLGLKVSVSPLCVLGTLFGTKRVAPLWRHVWAALRWLRRRRRREEEPHVEYEIRPRTYRGRAIPAEYEPDLVSVIVPTYNRADLLPGAMDSVWAQTYRPIELIVVDDGSTDGTREVVSAWVQEHDGDAQFVTRYLRHENSGVGLTRALGVVESRGEYLQFLDSDDYLAPERLSVLVQEARTIPGFQTIVSDTVVVDTGGEVMEVLRQPDPSSPYRIWWSMRLPLGPQAPLHHRSFIREVGFFRPEIPYGEDWEFGVRIACLCDPARCRKVDRPLSYWRQHGGQRLVDASGSAEELETLEPALRALGRLPGLRPRHHDVCAMMLVRFFTDRPGHDRRFLLRALRLPCSLRMKCKLLVLLALTHCIGASGATALSRTLRKIGRRKRPLQNEAL